MKIVAGAAKVCRRCQKVKIIGDCNDVRTSHCGQCLREIGYFGDKYERI
jgi:hypothetical protein